MGQSNPGQGARRSAGAMLVALAIAIAMGCQNEERAVGTTRHDDEPLLASKRPKDTDAPRTVVGTEAGATLEAIARATCERDDRCGRIGVGREHASYEVCTEKVKMDYVGELNSTECRWFDAEALEVCLRALRDERCDARLGALSRRLACRAGNICRLSARPNR